MQKLLELLPVFLGSGGLGWILNFQLSKRRQGNVIQEADFNAVSATVEKAMKQVGDLFDRVSQLEQEKSLLEQKMYEYQITISKLTREVEEWKKAYRDLIQKNNPPQK